jgi:hypothetical protein
MIYKIIEQISQYVKTTISTTQTNAFPYFFINLLKQEESIYYQKIKFNIIGYSNYDGVREINDMNQEISHALSQIKESTLQNYIGFKFSETKFDTEKSLRRLSIDVEVTLFKNKI